jgi:RNA-directed DNA polymerase
MNRTWELRRMHRNSENVSLKQERIATLAKQSPEMGFTSLIHHLDAEWLCEAYWLTRKDGAPGIDGETWISYGEALKENIEGLLVRLKTNSYRAPAVRRKYIPKAGSPGETRPLGIPTLEDKVLQRAIVMLLEPIYEIDFSVQSYGFRKGRSAHQALESLWQEAWSKGGGWILELDIRKFFDEIDHAHLMTFLKIRLRDSAVLRLIGKWLNAGVLEDGSISYPESGSPQGGVISPLLANIYLHYVLDSWFEKDVQPRMYGRTGFIRFADDAVFSFSNEADARRVLSVLPKRFARYGLRLHPEKTKMVDFRGPRGRNDSGNKGREVKAFDFLGFTHYWAKSRKGQWIIKRKTAKSRLARAIKAVRVWCKDNIHLPIREQQEALNRKIQGHCGYYGITGNSISLSKYRHWMMRSWQSALNRRNREHSMTWPKFRRMLERYPLRQVRATHSRCLA